MIAECYVWPAQAKALEKRIKAGKGKEMWIRKPVASSQGRGIYVVDGSKLMQLWQKSSFRKRSSVLQKYIERPMLIGGHKFDVRIYVVVTSFDPLRIYSFGEGIVRFCTKKYSVSRKNQSNRFGHLTNYSINKKSDDFRHSDSEDQGSKWSLSALWDYIRATFGPAQLRKIIDQFDDIIVKTVIAADEHMGSQDSKSQRSCFELFGFDLLLDKHFRAWLIEVNVSPSLMAQAPLDKRLKTMLMCDILHLIGVPASQSKPAKSDSACAVKELATSVSSMKIQGKSGQYRKRNRLALVKESYATLADCEKRRLYLCCEENERRGHFRRLFPPAKVSETEEMEKYERWLDLFATKRYANLLLRKFIAEAESDVEKIKACARKKHALEIPESDA